MLGLLKIKHYYANINIQRLNMEYSNKPRINLKSESVTNSSMYIHRYVWYKCILFDNKETNLQLLTDLHTPI